MLSLANEISLLDLSKSLTALYMIEGTLRLVERLIHTRIPYCVENPSPVVEKHRLNFVLHTNCWMILKSV
jgi:hypothetical protein